jgi:hypothetical protein
MVVNDNAGCLKQRGAVPFFVGTLPGAAGGPKALGIQGLDLALFGEWPTVAWVSAC